MTGSLHAIRIVDVRFKTLVHRMRLPWTAGPSEMHGATMSFTLSVLVLGILLVGLIIIGPTREGACALRVWSS